MKIIVSEKSFNPISIQIEKTLNKRKKLPVNVFTSTFKFFLFITFDELFMPIFFNHLQQYLKKIEEQSFWWVTLNPDPRLYFGVHFGFMGAIQFSRDDDEETYLSALNDYPKESPADALAHNSNEILISSFSNKWAIYGSRDADIVICAFSDNEQMSHFKLIYGNDLLPSSHAAGQYAYGSSGKVELIQEFVKNYSVESH